MILIANPLIPAARRLNVTDVNLLAHSAPHLAPNALGFRPRIEPPSVDSMFLSLVSPPAS